MAVVVPLETRDPLESLKPILALVSADMAKVNQIILDKAISDVANQRGALGAGHLSQLVGLMPCEAGGDKLKRL